MHTFTTIEKKDNISYKDFIENYQNKRIPIVFKNASAAWKANDIFNPDFFRKNFGHFSTSLKGKNYTINEILDLTEASTFENPAPYPILFEIPQQMPELLEMVDPVHMNYATPNWFTSNLFPYGKFGKSVYLFIGGKGNQYSLHNDAYHTNAWITQLYGDKKFIVFPKGQEEYLYAEKKGIGSFVSPINILKPDYEKYPLYKKATPLEITLHAGETIFIPNGIWHTTVAPGQNISFIFDQMNGSNFKSWRTDVFNIKKEESRIKAILAYTFALSAGTLCRAAELFGLKF